MPDIARIQRTPIGRSATCRYVWWPGSRPRRRSGRSQNSRNAGRIERYGARRNTRPVGRRRDRLLLEEQLDAVGERLEHAEGPGPVRADAVLHVGDDLAQAPDVEHHRDQQQHERRRRLADDDRARPSRSTPLGESGSSAATDHSIVSTRRSVTGGVDVDERRRARRRRPRERHERGARRGPRCRRARRA